VPGLCKSVSIDEIRKNNHILTPGRYIEFREEEDDGVAFEEKMKKLTTELKEQMAESFRLNDEIKKNLSSIGYEI
jgi:type I restriction enzyme M protein